MDDNKLDMEANELVQKQLSRLAFLAGAAAVASTAVLAACGGQAPSSAPSSSGSSGGGGSSKKYTLALVVGVKGDPFYVTMQKGAQAQADKLGATLVVDGPAQFDAPTSCATRCNL